MKITEYSINRKLVSYVVAIMIIGGGILAYTGVGRLEFPAFTIPTALIYTTYPGASALEVEQEVTDIMEQAAQQLSQVKKVRSVSKPGLSIIYVDIKDHYTSDQLPQVWDELRRKVNDNQAKLPPGAGPAMVNDDFGDEYGVFFAVFGDGFSYRELKAYADLLKRELLLVKNVASIDLWGDQREVITLEFSRSRMTRLGVTVQDVVATLNNQNQVIESGAIKIGTDYARIIPTGHFTSVSDLGELLIKGNNPNDLVYLKDVVTLKRGYQDPAQWIMQFNGKPAIGVGISTVANGNVVDMGNVVKKRLKALETDMPVGMEIGYIAYQSETVSQSVNAFIVNLIEAILIVIVVLCLTMGLSSGLLMGGILLLTILGTFVFMNTLGISFQLISLGALILALGMLVDNAIVVTEGILVKNQQGVERTKAALDTVKQTAWPLLGATFVAVLAFAAIGTSNDSTGEFLRSLFFVMAISLGLSWVLAVTLTPLFCIDFMPAPKKNMVKDPYSNFFYRGYKGFLRTCLNNKCVTLVLLLLGLASAVYGFKYVENSFFPNSRRPQFMIDFMKPEGSHISDTQKEVSAIEAYVQSLPGVTTTTSFIGQGALRFLLTYEPEMPNPSYGQLLVTVEDYRKIDQMIADIRPYLTDNYPDAFIKLSKFGLGPGGGTKIEARFSGPDPKVLRLLSNKTREIMGQDPLATEITDNFRQKTMVVHPKVNESAARRLGITRPLIADTLSMTYTGKTIAVYRENNTLIPIQLRALKKERDTINQIDNITIQSLITGAAVPLKQIVSGVESSWEDPVIHRVNRKRTITVQCNQLTGNASVLFERLRPEIEAIELPAGYTLEWGGEYESSNDGQKQLFKMIPLFFLLMVFVVLTLFNALRQTVIIFLCLPLSIIGVTAGLLLSGEPFGFMCLLGFIGLSGMLIKNAVVLIDQIDLEIGKGKHPFRAVLDSSVSRLRPVMMAALTTVLGMLPLVTDPFYVGMSITIISGLTFGTVLTLVVVPVLYASMFRIKSEKISAA
jgi:multidrug efflux pump subunit AcrB